LKKSIALLFALTVSSYGAACVNQSLSNLSTCEITTGNGGVFQLSNWSLTNPSLTGYVLTSGAFTASEINVSFSTTAVSFSVIFSDNPSGTAGFNPFAATAANNLDQQASYVTGFFITPLTGGPAGTISTVSHAIIDRADNGVPLGSLTVQKNYAGNSVIDPSMTLLEITGGATNPSLSQSNTTGSSVLAVVDFVALTTRTGGSISMFGYANTFSTSPLSSDVPEPVTFVLVGIGLAGAAALRRRG
jgi:hypothetical protein